MEGTLRVLLVDPDEDAVAAVRDSLADNRTGMAVETTGDAATAQDRLATDPFDCLVSVQDLPDGDGVDLLIDAREAEPELECLLLAEDCGPAVVQRAYAGGVDVSTAAPDGDRTRLLGDRIERLAGARPAEDPQIVPDRHFEALAQTTRVAIVTIDAESTIHYVNPAIEDVLGYRPAELVGEPLTTLMSDELARRHEAGLDRYRRTGERELDWDGVVLPGRHLAGHEVPLSIVFSEFERGGTRFFTGIARDVTDQRRRESRLAELNELAQALAGATSAREVCERTVEAARRTLDLPVTTIDLYDADAGRLSPVARTPAVEEVADGRTLFAGERDLRWEVFVEGEGREFADLVAETDLPASATALRSAIVLPIGNHGIFVTGATETDGFTGSDRHLATILVTTARSALDRVERERTVREQAGRLEERAEALARLGRLNDVIRTVVRAIGEAETREAVLEEVCSSLVDVASYRFAWVGTYDSATGTMTPAARAGAGDGYLGDVDLGADGAGAALGPVGRALHAGEPQVENDIYGDPPFEPWRRAALERGFRASVAVPLVHRDARYGVLNLFSDEPGAFGEDEVAVLADLGETIGFAVNAIDRQAALTGERSIELAFRVGPLADGLTGLADAVDGTVRLEDVLARPDESVRAFFTVEGAAPPAVEEWLAGIEGFGAPRLIAAEAPPLFECVLDGSHVLAGIVRRGGVPVELTAAAGEARLVIRLPRSLDVRPFYDLLEEHYADVELVARREREEAVLPRDEFEAEFRERLTERQREVLRTAYAAGYFESPRALTAHELAETLDLAQPTVSRHLRAAERTLLSMVFDDG